MEQVLQSYLEHICRAENVKINEPLSKHTTFHIGGNAKFFVYVQSKETLVKLISALDYIEYPYRVIGGGSNILALDRGYSGVIIRPQFCEIVENGNFLYADAGANLTSVVKKSIELGLTGLEFASCIPGTVGGAVFGNAGAHSSSIGDIVTLIDVLDGNEIRTLTQKECKFKYRNSIFKTKRNLIILGVYLHLRQRIGDGMVDYNVHRKQTQPTGFTAGCIFKNPNGDSAGRLIDDCGLKGIRIGGAMVSEKHANFIVNIGNASSRDVQKLISKIKKAVLEKHGVKLNQEIEILRS